MKKLPSYPKAHSKKPPAFLQTVRPDLGKPRTDKPATFPPDTSARSRADTVPQQKSVRRRTLVDHQAAGSDLAPNPTPASQSVVDTDTLSDQPGALRNAGE